jgi:hypothetical protein
VKFRADLCIVPGDGFEVQLTAMNTVQLEAMNRMGVWIFR